jgi:cob(I)alamin adenosyltransferase
MSEKEAGQDGYVVVLTGDGKGKTTSALGMALRACGHGARVAIVQFIKAGTLYGECVSAKSIEGLDIDVMGRGCVGMPGDTLERAEHEGAAAEALALAREKTMSGGYDMVILDEACVAVSLGLIDETQVLSLIDEKPKELHMVLTGRGATPRITERADLVTEMRMVKHPYYEGKSPIEGIEF